MSEEEKVPYQKVQIGLSPLGGAAISVAEEDGDGNVTVSHTILDVQETGELALHLMAIFNMQVAAGYARAMAEHAAAQKLVTPPTAGVWTP